MSLIFGEYDDEHIENLHAELKRRADDIGELRECVAMARVIIGRIGTTDANSSENIRRAERWISMSSKLIQRTMKKS